MVGSAETRSANGWAGLGFPPTNRPAPISFQLCSVVVTHEPNYRFISALLRASAILPARTNKQSQKRDGNISYFFVLVLKKRLIVFFFSTVLLNAPLNEAACNEMTVDV